MVRLGEEREDSGRVPLPHLRFSLLEPGVRASRTFYHPRVKMRKSPCPPGAQNRAGQGHTWACQVALVVKNLPTNAGDMRRGFDPWVGKSPWRRAWQPTAWRIQWTEKSGGLQSTGSQRVGRDSSYLAGKAILGLRARAGATVIRGSDLHWGTPPLRIPSPGFWLKAKPGIR